MTQSNLDPIFWHEKDGSIVNPAGLKEAQALLAADEQLYYLFAKIVQALRDNTESAKAQGNKPDQVWWHDKLPLAAVAWGDIIRARIKEATPDKDKRKKLVELLTKALAAAGVQQPQSDALAKRLDVNTIDRDDFTQAE